MKLILIVAGMMFAASLTATLLVRLGWRIARRKPRRFWRKALAVHVVLAPLCVFVLAPLGLGLFAAGRVGTRGDERGYTGPRIAADGTWILQSRATLRDEAEGRVTPDPDPGLVAAARAAAVGFDADDGVRLRAFLVPPRTLPPRCEVILVHGLFRGALELEPPAALFRDLGAETLLLEMRNHGGSGRAPATFGSAERGDVLAAAAWLRSDPGRAARPLVVFAVSLGTAAALRAAPDIPGLDGIVVDAPVDDLLPTAHRMLAEGARAGRFGPALPQPFRSVALAAIEWRNGFRFADVRPIEDAARLPRGLPALVIGGGDDHRVPPAGVRAVYDRIPSGPERKTLWIRAGSDHGQVWNDDPAGYRERIEAFLRLAAP